MALGTPEGLTDWLTDQGYSLPSTVPPEQLLQRGTNYIKAVYGSQFCGVPTGGVAQVDPWPRTGAKYYGVEIPSDLVPPDVEQAVYRAAFLEATLPNGLTLTLEAGKRIKRQKVEGAVEREFFDDASLIENGSGLFIQDGQIKGLLEPYLCKDTGDQYLQGLWTIGR